MLPGPERGRLSFFLFPGGGGRRAFVLAALGRILLSRHLEEQSGLLVLLFLALFGFLCSLQGRRGRVLPKVSADLRLGGRQGHRLEGILCGRLRRHSACFPRLPKRPRGQVFRRREPPLLPEALGGRGGRRGAVLGLALGLGRLRVDVVPVDTDVRAGEDVVLRPEATQEGEAFLLGEADVDLVQLLRICA